MNDAAMAQLRGGQIDVAIRSLAQVDRAKGVLFSSDLRTLAAAELGWANVLAGDLDTAQRWIDESRRRLAKSHGDGRLGGASMLNLAEAALSMRRGHAEEGVALLDKNWLLLRESSSGNRMRTLEVVRAFGEAGGGVRAYNVVSERLVRVQPALPGEFAFLGAKWPEMQAFLAAHDLAAKSST
jgi:hypothetical protein